MEKDAKTVSAESKSPAKADDDWETAADAKWDDGEAGAWDGSGSEDEASEETKADRVASAKPAEAKAAHKFVLAVSSQLEPGLAKCPRKGCNLAAVVDSKSSIKPSVVECRCGFLFCTCGFEDHQPTSCQVAVAWDELLKLPSRTRPNTMPCPQCNVSTRLDGGDNHMLCPGCRYQYCWLCRGAYDNHNWDDCKRIRDEAERSRLAPLDDPLYKEHKSRADSADAVLADVEKHVAALGNARKKAGSKAAVADQALSAAASCHRAIKWSHVQSWHLLRSGAKPPSQLASLQSELGKASLELLTLATNGGLAAEVTEAADVAHALRTRLLELMSNTTASAASSSALAAAGSTAGGAGAGAGAGAAGDSKSAGEAKS